MRSCIDEVATLLEKLGWLQSFIDGIDHDDQTTPLDLVLLPALIEDSEEIIEGDDLPRHHARLRDHSREQSARPPTMSPRRNRTMSLVPAAVSSTAAFSPAVCSEVASPRRPRTA